MKESARLVSRTLGMLAKEIKPGITTLYLDKLAHDFIKDHGAEPAFQDMEDFRIPFVFHQTNRWFTVSSKEEIKEGDVLSVDCGAVLNGFVGDHAYTFEIGEVKPETKSF